MDMDISLLGRDGGRVIFYGGTKGLSQTGHNEWSAPFFLSISLSTSWCRTCPAFLDGIGFPFLLFFSPRWSVGKPSKTESVLVFVSFEELWFTVVAVFFSCKLWGGSFLFLLFAFLFLFFYSGLFLISHAPPPFFLLFFFLFLYQKKSFPSFSCPLFCFLALLSFVLCFA
jgi:hypothetical protein